MPDTARRPFLQLLCMTGLVASGAPITGWAARKPPPRAESPLVGVDPLFVGTGLTARWQAAMRQDLGWAAQWSEMDSGKVLAQLEQVQQRLNRELNRARLAGDALPGAQFALSVNLRVWTAQGFDRAVSALQSAGQITALQLIEVQIYGAAAAALDPDHATDRAQVVLFRAT